MRIPWEQWRHFKFCFARLTGRPVLCEGCVCCRDMPRLRVANPYQWL